MSKYCGKCDVYDMFADCSNRYLSGTRFFIDNKQIAIHNQKELAPFYPFLVSLHCADKDGGIVHMTSRSYVDEHEEDILLFYLRELQKAYRNCKRKKIEITVEALMEKVSWNSNKYVKLLAERVAVDGEKATIDNLSMDGIIPVYRECLLKDMMSMGYPERAAREWVYNKGNSHDHADIHQYLKSETDKVASRIKHLSHDDLDGVACIILGKLAFGDNVDFVMCQNGTINDTVEKLLKNDADYDEVHLTDISVSYALAHTIQEKRSNYRLLDHHKTALPLNDFDWCHVQVEDGVGENKHMTCGAELYYHWLIRNNHLVRTRGLDNFVQAVRDYDTWRWVELGENGRLSENLNILLTEYGQEKFIDWFYYMLQNGPLVISSEDEAIIATYKRREAHAIEQKDKEIRRIVFQDYNIGVVYTEEHINIIGNTLCKRHPELDCVALVNMGHNSVSFRSTKDNVDVSAIAKVFGGGGHKSAAGAPFKETTPIDILQCLFGEDCAVWVK